MSVAGASGVVALELQLLETIGTNPFGPGAGLRLAGSQHQALLRAFPTPVLQNAAVSQMINRCLWIRPRHLQLEQYPAVFVRQCVIVHTAQGRPSGLYPRDRK